MSEVADAAGGDEVAVARGGDLVELVYRRALHRPVDLDRGAEEALDAAGAEVGDGARGVDGAGLGPAGERDLAAAGVDGDDDALAVGGEEGLDQLWIAQGRGADDDALGPGREHGVHGAAVAQPAPDLDRALDGGGYAAHGLQVLRLPRLRPVEVDHVEELGAFAGP